MTLEHPELARLIGLIEDTLAQSQRAVRLMTTALLLMVFMVVLNLIALLLPTHIE
jgi:hypothetical protein